VRHVDAAVSDLAARLGIATTDVEVVIAEDVTWRDGSLGCPHPGMRYPQVLVDGYRVVLRHGERTYHYHGGMGRGPFLCEHPAPPPGAPTAPPRQLNRPE